MSKIKGITTKKNIFIFIVFVVAVFILILAGVLIGKIFSDNNDSYHAVYMDTGDLYFGELSTFPSLSLSNVWYVQGISQSEGGGLSINDFTKTVWGPTGSIFLNDDHVVWKVKLSDKSEIIPLLKGMNEEQNNSSK